MIQREKLLEKTKKKKRWAKKVVYLLEAFWGTKNAY